MKALKYTSGLIGVLVSVFSVTGFAQFDDVYFDPSDDMYQRTSSEQVASGESDSYNYTRDRGYADEDSYAYDDEEYDYYHESNNNYYFDDYAYARRINRFHRNNFFYGGFVDPFLYDMYAYNSFYSPFYSPFRSRAYMGSYYYDRHFFNPYFRPGFSFSLGFGSPWAYRSPWSMGGLYGYGAYGSPFSYYNDPIMAYNYYNSGYPYVYRNNVNHLDRPVYYKGARSTAGVVPSARDGRIQIRSSRSGDNYEAPTRRVSPRGEDRSNRSSGIRSSNGSDDTRMTTDRRSPRSNVYKRVERDQNTSARRSPAASSGQNNSVRSNSSERSTRTYTPRTKTRRSYTPSSSNQNNRNYSPRTNNSNQRRSYTPSRSNRNSGTYNNGNTSRRSYSPSSRSSGSSSRSSGSSSSSSSRRSSPRG